MAVPLTTGLSEAAGAVVAAPCDSAAEAASRHTTSMEARRLSARVMVAEVATMNANLFVCKQSRARLAIVKRLLSRSVYFSAGQTLQRAMQRGRHTIQ